MSFIPPSLPLSLLPSHLGSIVVLLINLVMEYCQCADDLPMLVNEVMSKLIETLKVQDAHWLIEFRAECVVCFKEIQQLECNNLSTTCVGDSH